MILQPNYGMTIHDLDPNNPSIHGCMATVSGRIVDLLNPSPDMITLEDIAHGLAHNFRWNGHTYRGYSVAEHVLRVTEKVSDRAKPYAVFHDSEEAYWDDMIRPLKMVLKEEGSSLIAKMKYMRLVILSKFGITWDEDILDEVKRVDNEEMSREFKGLLLSKGIIPLAPALAKEQWLSVANSILRTPY